MCVYIYICIHYIYIYIYIYIHTYIYIERYIDMYGERERDKERDIDIDIGILKCRGASCLSRARLRSKRTTNSQLPGGYYLQTANRLLLTASSITNSKQVITYCKRVYLLQTSILIAN